MLDQIRLLIAKKIRARISFLGQNQFGWEWVRKWKVDIKSGRRSFSPTSYSNTRYKSHASKYSASSSRAWKSLTISYSSPCRPTPRLASQNAFQLPSRTSRNTRSISFQWRGLWLKARHWDTSILTRSAFSQSWSLRKGPWTLISRHSHISIIRQQVRWLKSFPAGVSHHSSLEVANRSWVQLLNPNSNSNKMMIQHHRLQRTQSQSLKSRVAPDKMSLKKCRQLMKRTLRTMAKNLTQVLVEALPMV